MPGGYCNFTTSKNSLFIFIKEEERKYFGYKKLQTILYN